MFQTPRVFANLPVKSFSAAGVEFQHQSASIKTLCSFWMMLDDVCEGIWTLYSDVNSNTGLCAKRPITWLP